MLFRSYLKFNLNNVDKDSFIRETNRFKTHVDQLTSNNSNSCVLLDSDQLLTSTLDKNFYQTAIHHFNLSDSYEIANYVHGLWYKLQKKSEIELLEDLTTIYKE